MDFLKKNYEKVVLGAVLLGLVVAVVFLLMYVQREKEAQETRRTSIVTRPVKPLDPPDLGSVESLLQRGNSRVMLNFQPPNRLLNPLRWGKAADGHVFVMDPNVEINRIQVTNSRPLYFTVSLDGVSTTESGARYAIGIEQQSGAGKGRGKTQEFASANDRKKKAFTLIDVKGPPDNPTALDLELADTGEQISISKDKPYRRVDGYMVDVKYPPESRNFPNCRVDSKITFGGNTYKVVAVTQDEVVLLADSNQKKWTIKYSATP